MKDIVNGEQTFKQIIDNYDVNNLWYAKLVGCLKGFNCEITECSTSDDIDYTFHNLIKDLDEKYLERSSHDVGENESKLLKLVYFLILANESGSNVVERILRALDSRQCLLCDNISQKVYNNNIPTLNDMFNEYYGLGDPVCKEILSSILNLINFVKSMSAKDYNEE